jgi:flagellar biosynthetic protein FliP
MTAAMFVPAFALIACYWLGAVSADAVCPMACALMIPAMAVAMVFRIDEYTTQTHSEHARRG